VGGPIHPDLSEYNASPPGDGIWECGLQPQLKKLDPTHNNRLQIALEAFCINRTQNLLTKARKATLQQRREIKIANMVVKIMAKPEHPIDTWETGKFMISTDKDRASHALFSLEPKLSADVEQTAQPEYAPWITLLALPKGSSTLRIKTELETILNTDYPIYTQIYKTDPNGAVVMTTDC
jgi:hypothetical protein